MSCAESLRVQAWFDGEVGALTAAGLERHLEHCASCQALLAELEETRRALRSGREADRAPPALRAQILRALDREPGARASNRRVWRLRPFWLGVLGGLGGAAAAAAAVAVLLLAPLRASPLLDELVAAHVRALMPLHLIDVASTDQHTVKPWFAGHADVSPVVADFAPQGFRLVGGRADYLEDQRAAVVVFQHGAHLINVFSWSAGSRRLPDEATRRGYHLVAWRVGDLEYCAVSDAGWEELRQLERLLQELGARDSRG